MISVGDKVVFKVGISLELKVGQVEKVYKNTNEEEYVYLVKYNEGVINEFRHIECSEIIGKVTHMSGN